MKVIFNLNSSTLKLIRLVKKYIFLFFACLPGLLFTLSLNGQAPTYTLELRNDVQTSPTEFEFDIFLLRTGSVPFEYAIGQYGILLNPNIKNGGSLIATIVSGSVDPVLAATNQDPASVNFFDAGNVIRISPPAPPGSGNGALISNIPPGTRICRVRVSNTSAYGQYSPNLS